MKTKKPKIRINLDDLDIGEHGVIEKDDIQKLRETTFKQGKRPSVIARTLAAVMFKNMELGQWVKAENKSWDADYRKAALNAFKKDLIRAAKAVGKTGYRVRGVDGGNRFSFWFEKKMSKEEKQKQKTARLMAGEKGKKNSKKNGGKKKAEEEDEEEED